MTRHLIMRKPVSPINQHVWAVKDFTDVDGVHIRKGQYLGELHKAGYCKAGYRTKRQMWWTQNGGYVTANFGGDFTHFVTRYVPGTIQTGRQ